ncbi:hypothetical protein DI392_08140 [Vibrio albus]|uniref:Uncharacterized protein n=1 Tax=Vibrio albus TaxID=2200953 RepID=A0A2U3BBJ2_9VIBR|nr:hypothetical protein [Vibrio albus]PWI34147.1 hypothetical protein DI392_08140 [Vibrio albus]
MNQTVKVFYDVMPDNTVSVLVQGSCDWDLLMSYRSLVQWCEMELGSFELIDITDTTYQQRRIMGVFA